MVQSNTANKDIINENVELIHRVVMAIAAEEHLPELQMILAQAEANGWTRLVVAIRKILAGEREMVNLGELDEEDQAIVSAILQGLRDPSSLPDLVNAMNPDTAGPSMANMIHDAAGGSAAAVNAIKAVSAQMGSTESGDFSRLPVAINLMVAGERREEVLCRDMGAAGTSLVHAILQELNKLEA